MSAVWTVQEAIDGAILADAQLAPLLRGDKVYSLLGPGDDDSMPYVVLSQSAESNWGMFDTPAFSGTETISVYASDLSKKTVALLAAHLVRILSLPLSLDGYNFVTGEPAIISLGLDQDMKASRAILSYSILSHA